MPSINTPKAAAGNDAARNGNSAEAASAAATNPDPMARLVEALAPSFGDQAAASAGAGGESNLQVPPAQGAGRTASATPGEAGTLDATNRLPPAEAGAAEETPAAPGDETEIPDGATPEGGLPEEGEPEAGSQETEGGERGEETTEPDDTQLPKGLQKRIGKLLGKLEEQATKIEALEARLNAPKGAETESARAAGEPGAELPSDPVQLEALERRAQQGFQQAEVLLSRLAIAPRKVEEFLRNAGVVLRNGQGEEDYSPEAMGEALIESRESFRAQMEAVPRRRAYLAQHQAVHTAVVKALPWVGDKTDPRRARMDALASQAPQIRAMPNWEYWLACAVEGERALKARFAPNGQRAPTPAARRAGNGTAPAARGGQETAPPRRTTSTPGGAPSAAPRPGNRSGQIAAAKQRVLKEGTQQALADAFETIGLIK